MIKLSVVINTLNEEKNLPRVIGSIKNLADEIVVVDMKSDDKTANIAKKLGAKVYEHERTNYVEPARNFALQQAQGDWILVLDADEEMPDILKKKIKKIIDNPKSPDYFRIPRKNIIFGKWIKHSRWWPDYNIRLFRRGKVVWNEVIHSVPMTQGVGADLPEKEELAIMHHHYVSISQYLERLNRYSTIQAKDRIKNGYKFNWIDLLKKPAGEFLSRFFAGGGYKDGIHGLTLGLLQAFSEAVVVLKVWEEEKFTAGDVDINEFSRITKHLVSDLRFWQSDMLLKTKGGGLILRLKRKFRI